MPTMSLSAIKSTADGERKPLTILLYGVEGVGKTTFAADAPGVVFIPIEKGFGRGLDVPAFPMPEKWEEVLQAIKTLRTDKHDYRTLAIDTLDRLERVLWEYLCRTNGGKSSIEDFGYGKGYAMAVETWQKFAIDLEKLVFERGMSIILLAHAAIRVRKNPGAPDYDHYTLKMHEKSGGFFREWVDFLLFAEHEVYTSETKTGKIKASSAGHRIVHTAHTAKADAKNRAGLPAIIPLDFDYFYREATTDSPERKKRLIEQIEETIARLPEVDRPKAKDYLGKISENTNKLSKFLDFCRGKIATEETEKKGEEQ